MLDIREVSLRVANGAAVDEWTWTLSAVAAGEANVDSAAARARVKLSLEADGSLDFELSSGVAWTQDIDVFLSFRDNAAHAEGGAAWPLFYGAIEERDADDSTTFSFFGPGGSPARASEAQRLALPFVIARPGTDSGHLKLYGTDPLFSTDIRIGSTATDALEVEFAWTYRAAAGIHRHETRRLFAATADNYSDCLDLWFPLATPEVPPAPNWVHDVVIQDFDYMSTNGQGWYADIDAACEIIPAEERHRALFTLHGWYDRVGRFAFDVESGELDEQWVTLPFMHHPQLRKRFDPTPGPVKFDPKRTPSAAALTYRNLDDYGPITMTWGDIRNRLMYAKQRGFRTSFYVMTGMLTEGANTEDFHGGRALESPSYMWFGPDIVGETHIRNPLHEDIASWAKSYFSALVARVGDLVDSWMFDEAFYVGRGVLGPSNCPGYADRAQALLLRELAAIAHEAYPESAFLIADALGQPILEGQAYPYSLQGDGIYQDAWCLPTSWDATRFPAWRNVSWGCSWAPITNFAWTKYGVIAHGAPIAISNGCFGDDTGLSEVDAEGAAAIANLYQMAKTTTGRRRRLPISNQRSAEHQRADA